MSHTHDRIMKLARRGLSPESIAKKIGRPGDLGRVRQAMERENRIRSERGLSEEFLERDPHVKG